MRRRGLLVCSAAVIAAGIVISDAHAQTGGNALFTYPMQGQTPEQESADRSACHNWAVQQTGFDPSAIFIAQRAGVPTRTIANITRYNGQAPGG